MGDSPVKPPARQRIQAVDRASALLKAVAASDRPLSAQELARACGINRSTAWRLLATLEDHGLVEQDPATRRYAVGYASVQLAAGSGHDAVVRRARPVLEGLCRDVEESVTFAVAARFHLEYVDQVDPPGPPSPSWLGRAIPLHATSAGKVFLACLPAEERASVLPRVLEGFTETTIVDPDALERELDAVHRAGYATCVGEYEGFSNGVSAAVLDRRGRPLAVVNVWGPSPRVTEERLPALAARTIAAATQVAERLR
jgi:DNA-binding IclR family transcriptional regulator